MYAIFALCLVAMFICKGGSALFTYNNLLDLLILTAKDNLMNEFFSLFSSFGGSLC